MKKNLLMLSIALLPIFACATGMAVSMDNLYLKNNNKTEELVTIKNIDPDKKIKIPASSMCKINTKIMFLPPDYETTPENTANYIVSVSGNNFENNIIMDKFGLSLAYDSFIKAPYSGNVKNFTFTGYCGSKYQQFRYLSVNDAESGDAMPEFKLANCKSDSNYVYMISKSYVKVSKKSSAMDFNGIPECNLVAGESK